VIEAMNAAPDMATFARLVNSQFRLRLAGEATADAELVELRQGPASPSYEQFSLVFHAPSGTPPEQRIYTLEHAEAGIFELFLVPIGRTDRALLLEAVISRRVEPAAGGD
jgi:hypothetical protein